MAKKKHPDKKQKPRGKCIITLLVLICLLVSFTVWQTNDITVTDYTYSSAALPAAFGGFRIVQLSDIHAKLFGKDQSRLLTLIEKASPDLIVITGDQIDETVKNLDSITALFAGAAAIAPVYYVEGNHDRVSGYYKTLRRIAAENGAVLLNNKTTALKREKDRIKLVGIADPMHFSGEAAYEEMLGQLLQPLEDQFTILLSHRPENLALYERYGADICFTGHAHGGQIALPFIGALYAPNQGWFPEYTSGMYQSGDTTMYVSRGLGTVGVPIRLFARPQIICVTLSVS